MGKTKAEIIQIMGDNYMMDPDGNVIYVARIMFFFKQIICIGFNTQYINDIIHSIGSTLYDLEKKVMQTNIRNKRTKFTSITI